MTRRWIAGMALLSLLAGCGGGGSDPAEPAGATETTTTTAATAVPPARYSAAELLAALPTAKDLPGGLTLTRTCPTDAGGCDMYEEGRVVAEISAEPASPVGAEQIQDQVTPKDFVALQAKAHPDSASAADAVRDAGRNVTKFDGAYEVTQEDGRTSRGKGATADQAIGAWTGHVHGRTEVSSDAESDQGLLVAVSFVASGPHHVSAFVSVSAAGRDPAAATDLADSLVREYIERLES